MCLPPPIPPSRAQAEVDDAKSKLFSAAAEAASVRALLSGDEWLRSFRQASGATASDEALRKALIGDGLDAGVRAARRAAREAADAQAGSSLLRWLMGSVAQLRRREVRAVASPSVVEAEVLAEVGRGGGAEGSGRDAERGGSGAPSALRVAAGASVPVPAIASLPPRPPPPPGPKGLI